MEKIFFVLFLIKLPFSLKITLHEIYTTETVCVAEKLEQVAEKLYINQRKRKKIMNASEEKKIYINTQKLKTKTTMRTIQKR